MGERTRGRFPNRGEEEEDERGRFSCLGPAGDVKKGVAGSRFVGNSFLLFEPVFSLARRLYISPPSLAVYARTNIRGARPRDRSYRLLVNIYRWVAQIGKVESRDSRLFLRTRIYFSFFFLPVAGENGRVQEEEIG